MKSDANSCPQRGLSHGEAILYVGEGIDAHAQMVVDGRVPGLSASMNLCADSRNRIGYDHSAGPKHDAIPSLRQQCFARLPVGQEWEPS